MINIRNDMRGLFKRSARLALIVAVNTFRLTIISTGHCVPWAPAFVETSRWGRSNSRYRECSREAVSRAAGGSV
jgi:hypothetical protein